MSFFPDAVPSLKETEYRADPANVDAAGRGDLLTGFTIWALLIALLVGGAAGVAAVVTA